VISWDGNSSASHQAMSRVTRLATSELRAVPGIRNVSAHVGRALMSDKKTSINAGEIWVNIDPSADYDATVAAMREVVSGYPGLTHDSLGYLQTKIRKELIGNPDDDLVVRVYGEDLEIIRSKAEEVKQVLEGIDGIYESEVQYIPERPTLEIEVDLDKAKRYGLKPGDVRRATTSLVSGIEVGNLFDEQKVFDVLVWGTPDTRHSLTSIQNLLIDIPSGGHVLLKEVADVRIVPSVTVINREAVARHIDVTADVRGRDITAVAAQIEHSIRGLDFPLEYRAELVGEHAELLSARRDLLAFAIAAAIGIFLLLQAFFRSWRLATAVFVILPMALLGGVLVALFIGDRLVSFASIVGLIAVLGIAVRNCISLVSHFRLLERESGVSGVELVLRGARERSVPILMTAVTLGLALFPLAFFGSRAGLEIAHPMALVVMGGLVTSIIFTLVGVPAIYVLFGATREPELELHPVTSLDEDEVKRNKE
jgi:Cu/Ag efflux pump CusA